MEAKHKHLEFLQLTITRMSTNSFLLKGWTVTLIAAILALSSSVLCKDTIFLALMPILVFWILDGYYLWQERLYRALYDQVRLYKDENIDYSMHAIEFNSENRTWFRSIFSKTLIIFYGILFLLTFILIYFI